MNIALIGYGRMGREIEQIARSRGHEIVCIIDVDNRHELGSAQFRSADVAIEFTNPDAAYDNCRQTFAAGVKLVSGSTGWLDKHRDEIESLCREGNTLFWASNFSLGVAIFSAVNRYLAGIMNSFPAYSVSMTETHHVHKLDAPSGTAITLAEGIIGSIDRLSQWSLAPNATADSLPIRAIREGEVFGIHSVCYDSPADCITITHDAHNRSGFALGAVLAAEFTLTHSGMLSMSDLFPFLHC